MSPSTYKLRLSPLTRLMMTFDHELMLDNGSVFNADRYGRLISMLGLVERRRDHTLKVMLAFDALTVLLLAGSHVTVPGFGISLNDIPAGVESATFVASLGFLFLANAQVNWHGYTAMIDQMGRRMAGPVQLDPEFVTAADKVLEFVVKVYRPKMNLDGEDFFVPGRGYRVFAYLVTALFIGAVLCVLVAHFGIVGWSAWTTLAQSPNGLVKWAYLAFVLLTNLGALLVFLTLNLQFEFEIAPRAFDISSRSKSSDSGP